MVNGVTAYFKNLSPAKVNGFLDWRSKWFLSDIMKRRLPDSPDMKRGNAVEQGIVQNLLGNLSLEDAQAYAMKLFVEETADLDIDEVAECGASIPDLIAVGVEALKPYGKVESAQRKVTGEISGTRLPWFGYSDIGFEGNVTVDLKVTGKTPSKMSFGHCRQGSFYKTYIPECQRVDFVYLIPLVKGVKTVTHTIEDAERHINDLRIGAQAMDRVLSISDKPLDLAPFFMPAPGDWWLSDPMAQALASEVWGISDFTPKQEEIAA